MWGFVLKLMTLLMVLSLIGLTGVAGFELDSRATVTHIEDGDTIKVSGASGFKSGEDYWIRFADIDAPESDTSEGQMATSDLESKLDVGASVSIDVDDRGSSYGPYGRVIGVVYKPVNETHLLNLNKYMVSESYAHISDYDTNEFNPYSWSLYEEKVAPNTTPIQDAVDAASAGDTIILGDGYYQENVVVDVPDLVIKSENGSADCIIDGGGSGDTVNITADNVTIEGFTITGSGSSYNPPNAGLKVKSSGNTITQNTITSNNGDGIILDSSSNNNITQNTITNNAGGIHLKSSSSNTITSNKISNNYDGIYLDEPCSNNTIASNNISNNEWYGIILLFSSSDNNNITSNKITSNNRDGINLGSSNNTITSNNISNNEWNGIKLFSSNYNTITSNKITSNNDDGIKLDESSSNTITSNNISNSGRGINLSSSSNNTIIQNNITSNNMNGIRLDESSSNTISSNNISNNYGGIDLFSSSDNTIGSNNISNNDKGIWLCSSNYNTVTSNNISSNNDKGIWLDGSSSNTITQNNISSNNDDGIYLHSSSDNIIYLNNFVDNSDNVDSEDSNNIWSSEKITYTYNGNTYTNYLGNYWSEFNETDSDEDGIGDTSYSVDGDNDNYPLIQPWQNYNLEPQPTLMEGDVTMDGKVDVVDAMFIAQYTVDIRDLNESQLQCADTTDEGDVDITDAMLIAQYTVGDPFKPLWQSPADDGMKKPVP